MVVLLLERPERRAQAARQRAAEDARPVLGVELDELLSPVAMGAGVVGHGESGGEDAARRGARQQPEQRRHRRLSAALELGKHDRRDQAADAAAVDRKDVEGHRRRI
jgi:hypothetical protein